MIELLMLILAIVGVVLFNENRSRLKKAESDIFLMRQRLDRLEQQPRLAAGGVVVAAEVAAAEAETGPVPVAEPGASGAEPESKPLFGPEVALPAMAEAAQTNEEPTGTSGIMPPVSTGESPSGRSLESRLGAQWTVWIGGLALALGGLFVVKYAIDQGLLNPAVRTALAGLFGLVLMAAGEIIRRRTPEAELANFRSAMIPGIVTAAGTLTLFGTVYVAHNFYDFIGPAMAFILLGIVSLAAIGLSLLHGQAMAGLGLLASLVTPAMIASSEPRPWSLFGFLTIVWLATYGASRIRRWNIVPSLANLGLGGWACLYILDVTGFEYLPVTLSMLVMLAGIAFFWPGGDVAEDRDSKATFSFPASPHMAIMVSGALSVMLVALGMVAPDTMANGPAHWAFFTLIIALAALGAWRPHDISPAALSALGAIIGLLSLTEVTTSSTTGPVDGAMAAWLDPATIIRMGLVLGLVFVGLGVWVVRRFQNQNPPFAIVWSVLSMLAPLALAATTYLYFGNFERDWTHGAYALLLAAIFLALSDWTARRQEAAAIIKPADILLAGHYLAVIATILVLTNGLATTLLAAVVGFAYVLAARLRPWPLLPWLMVASAIFVAGRIAWDPTIVGPGNLSTTPIFNQLLAGYGLPALFLVIAAWINRNSASERLRNALEALASLFVLLTLTIEIRHLMHGGVLDEVLPTLSEQSTYTLLAIGASATMLALDFRRSSPVFKIGSIVLAIVSMLMVLAFHLGTLNPYFSGEMTGSIPVFNLLLIGYLLPGIGYAALAWMARDRRPVAFVRSLALAGAILAFAYVTLSVRRFWHGQSIADWQGFIQNETYTYSVVWLLLGVVLLLFGYRFKAQSIRIASAVLVFITVFKVFLIDMSNLEGLLRALSFIGLGIVLIGIGRFYQHILLGAGKMQKETGPKPEAPPDMGARTPGVQS
jgi:uncharacterized membrane protein